MSLIILLIAALLMAGYVLLLFHYRKSWQSIPDFIIPEHTASRNNTFISVIVAARNEEKNISKLIAAIQKQNF